MEAPVYKEEREIPFDPASGFSVEEQEEILREIQAIAGEGRLLSEENFPPAKKRGLLFPLLINGVALVILGLGFALLFFFNAQDDQGIRAGSAPLGHTERMLIQEIRSDTIRQLHEKEDEINEVLIRLSQVDMEYRSLQNSVEALTETQMERAAFLLGQLDEYRGTIRALQLESAEILEDSRLRETALRLEANQGDTILSSEALAMAASSALDELRALSAEQDRASRIEGQMGGYFTMANTQIFSGHLDEASLTLGRMRDFLETPGFQGIRAFQERKQTHLAAITAMEMAVTEALRLRGERDGGGQSLGTQEEQEALALMAERVASLERDLALFASQGSDLDRILAVQAEEINTLRREVQEQETQALELSSTLTGLRTQVEGANTRASQAEAALDEERRENSALLIERDDLQRELTRFRDAARSLLED
ncbi:MAG: hypothetical protein FWH12_06650 [Treponema sp.]|nr:hypothetical protein [Treponema sp.]